MQGPHPGTDCIWHMGLSANYLFLEDRVREEGVSRADTLSVKEVSARGSPRPRLSCFSCPQPCLTGGGVITWDNQSHLSLGHVLYNSSRRSAVIDVHVQCFPMLV